MPEPSGERGSPYRVDDLQRHAQKSTVVGSSRESYLGHLEKRNCRDMPSNPQMQM